MPRSLPSLLLCAILPVPALAAAPGPLERVRATRLAVRDILSTSGDAYPAAGEILSRLRSLESRLEGGLSGEEAARLARSLQREAFVRSPLLRHPVLYVTRPQYRSDHHNTATMFQTGEINTGSFHGRGALRVVDLREGRVSTLVEAPEGVVRDPELSPDARRVLFSMRRSAADDYHVWEVAVDGSGLRQLSFGAGISDIDPVWLPDGSIVMTSTREPKYCMCNRHIMGNLFRMDSDGANVRQIGHSTLHEGHPAVLPDGRILYDRWEYIDRNFGDAQGVWTCNPDGTNHAVFYGNNTKSPGGVIDARAIAGTERFIATFTSCHDRPWGALALVDRGLGIDGKHPVVRTWPPAAIDLVMTGNYDRFREVSPKYEDPWPLAARDVGVEPGKYFLCSRQLRGEEMAILLVDVFGNEVLLHSEAPGCYDPMTLAPRASAGVMPDRTDLARREGSFYIHDVYIGTGMEAVPRGSVRSVRVVESPEKRFWTHTAWNGSGTQAPAMAWDDFNNKRILGTAPVEPDGSAYFSVPADRFVYLQLLDARGRMVQSMRSGTIARPGEVTGCVGCHEGRLTSVPNEPRQAFRRGPSPLEPWYGEERLFSYRAEVQPVFDRYCVSCHDFGEPAGEHVNLAGDPTLAFCVSYMEIRRRGLVKVVGAGPAEVQAPGTWGARRSRLIEVLDEGHEGVELDAESMHRLVTWIDINAPYYSSYASSFPANLFGRSPLDNAQLGRLRELTGVDLLRQRAEPAVSFARPHLSPCLAELRKTPDDARYLEALEIIRAGREALARTPRPDLPGHELVGLEAERQQKYERLFEQEAAARRALVEGGKHRAGP